MDPLKVEIINNSSIIRDFSLIFIGWLFGLLSLLLSHKLTQHTEKKKSSASIKTLLLEIDVSFKQLLEMLKDDSVFFDKNISKDDYMEELKKSLRANIKNINESFSIYYGKYAIQKLTNIQIIINTTIHELYPNGIIPKQKYELLEQKMIIDNISCDFNNEIAILIKLLNGSALFKRIFDKRKIESGQYFNIVKEKVERNLTISST